METKIAKNEEEALQIADRHEGRPRGWIQYKGTDVCMDIHCKCGAHMHIDTDFCYIIKCPHCNTLFSVQGYVELIEIKEVKYGIPKDPEPDEEHLDPFGNPIPLEE